MSKLRIEGLYLTQSCTAAYNAYQWQRRHKRSFFERPAILHKGWAIMHNVLVACYALLLLTKLMIMCESFLGNSEIISINNIGVIINFIIIIVILNPFLTTMICMLPNQATIRTITEKNKQHIMCMGHVDPRVSKSSELHWNLSSMVAPKVVIMTTSGATNDDKFGILTTLVFSSKIVCIHCGMYSVWAHVMTSHKQELRALHYCLVLPSLHASLFLYLPISFVKENKVSHNHNIRQGSHFVKIGPKLA